jgi:hypothetical protein
VWGTHAAVSQAAVCCWVGSCKCGETVRNPCVPAAAAAVDEAAGTQRRSI